MVGLALVDMRWISDEGVRWGREEGAGFVGRAGEGDGGGGRGGVVEIARMVIVGWDMRGGRWNGADKGVFVTLGVVSVGCRFRVGKDVGHGWRGMGIGLVLAGRSSEPSQVSKPNSHFHEFHFGGLGKSIGTQRRHIHRSCGEVQKQSHIHSSLHIRYPKKTGIRLPTDQNHGPVLHIL